MMQVAQETLCHAQLTSARVQQQNHNTSDFLTSWQCIGLNRERVRGFRKQLVMRDSDEVVVSQQCR